MLLHICGVNMLEILDLTTFRCHKWIAVGDIFLDFTLMAYDPYNFNDIYIVESSGDQDGVYCVFRPRRNSFGRWARKTLMGFIKHNEKLMNFISLRAPFLHLRVDETVMINGQLKQKVFIFFPSMNTFETAVTCLFLKHYDYKYGVTDQIPF